MTAELLVKYFRGIAVRFHDSRTSSNPDSRRCPAVLLSPRFARFLGTMGYILRYSRPPNPYHTLATTVPNRDCLGERCLSPERGEGPNTTHRTHPHPEKPHTENVTAVGHTSLKRPPLLGRLLLWGTVCSAELFTATSVGSADSDEFLDDTESLLSGSDQHHETNECRHQAVRQRQDHLSGIVSRPRRAARPEAARRNNQRRHQAVARDGVRPVAREALSRSPQPSAVSAHEAREDASREQLNDPRRGPDLARMQPTSVGTEFEARTSALRRRPGRLLRGSEAGGICVTHILPVACSAGVTVRPRRNQ